MARVRIPDEYKGGFIQFATITDSQRQQIVDIVSSNTAKTSTGDIAKQVAESLSLDTSEAYDIVNSVVSIAYGRDNPRTTIHDLIDAVIDHLTSSEAPPADNVISSVRDALTSFLSTKNLYYATSKAQALSFQRERLYLNAKVVTDIRPIFNDNEDCTVEGEVIIHTLRIECQKGYDYEHLYIALDTNDLLELKTQIERAERKESALRQSITNLPDKVY